MCAVFTSVGKEYVMKNGFSGETNIDVGLYLDSIDSLDADSDLTDINTEPGNTDYDRQSTDFSTYSTGVSWGILNDDALTYDFTDQTATDLVYFDSWFIVINFQSEEKGDGSPQDHLLAAGPLVDLEDAGILDLYILQAGDTGDGTGVGFIL